MPTEITKLAERVWIKAAKAIYRITVISTKFVTVKQLKLGDVLLSLYTMKEAEIIYLEIRDWKQSIINVSFILRSIILETASVRKTLYLVNKSALIAGGVNIIISGFDKK
ncbi:hypothetical protein N7465_012010 [Penicillium sp. CMV-2018d]|nr:hypothetical protein N7465_012010 [Penicillium sp. CMV-2018d]